MRKQEHSTSVNEKCHKSDVIVFCDRERLFFIRPWAWFLQGDGFRADEKHALRNDVKAALCYHIAAKKVRTFNTIQMKNEPDDSACQDDENNTNKEYMEAYDAICSNLNNKQTSEVLNEANEQHMLTSLGFISDEIGNNIYRVMVRFVAVSIKYNCQRPNESM